MKWKKNLEWLQGIAYLYYLESTLSYEFQSNTEKAEVPWFRKSSVELSEVKSNAFTGCLRCFCKPGWIPESKIQIRSCCPILNKMN